MSPVPMPPGYQATKPFIEEEDPQSRLPPGSIAVLPSPSWWAGEKAFQTRIRSDARPVPPHCWTRLRRHAWGPPVVRDLYYFTIPGSVPKAFPRDTTWTCTRCGRTKDKTQAMVPPKGEGS